MKHWIGIVEFGIVVQHLAVHRSSSFTAIVGTKLEVELKQLHYVHVDDRSYKNELFVHVGGRNRSPIEKKVGHDRTVLSNNLADKFEYASSKGNS